MQACWNTRFSAETLELSLHHALMKSYAPNLGTLSPKP